LLSARHLQLHGRFANRPNYVWNVNVSPAKIFGLVVSTGGDVGAATYRPYEGLILAGVCIASGAEGRQIAAITRHLCTFAAFCRFVAFGRFANRPYTTCEICAIFAAVCRFVIFGRFANRHYIGCQPHAGCYSPFGRAAGCRPYAGRMSKTARVQKPYWPCLSGLDRCIIFCL